MSGRDLDLTGLRLEAITRQAAPIASALFVLGFAWAQFGAMQSGLAETRAELADLRREFVAFRVSGERVDRLEFAAALVRQRDVDHRQDRVVALLTERILALPSAEGAR